MTTIKDDLESTENEKEEVTSASKDSTEKIQVISSTTDVNLQDFSSNDAADDFKQNILDNRVNPISTTSNYISSYMTPKPLYAQNDAAKITHSSYIPQHRVEGDFIV